jgi:hypothetical protein
MPGTTPEAPEPLGMPAAAGADGRRVRLHARARRRRLIYEAAGQSVFGIQGPTTVAAQMTQLVDEMDAAWSRLHTWVN